MQAIKARYGAEQVAFSVTSPSGTHISDSIAWIERLIRAFGSPNNISATEICNWHKASPVVSLMGATSAPGFRTHGLRPSLGQQSGSDWLARANEIQRALKRGARLIVVDPRPIEPR